MKLSAKQKRPRKWANPIPKKLQTIYVCLEGDFSSPDRDALVRHHNKKHKEWNKMKFNSEDKEVNEFGDNNWLPFGVSKVKIASIELGNTNTDEPENGKEYIEFTVVSDTGEEDTARCWFTGGATNISFNTIRQIYVHNAPEEHKDAARDTMDAITSTEELAEALNEKLTGGECWFTKYYDPERTYQNAKGVTKRSINKNIVGYEPKLKPSLMPQDESGSVPDAVTDAFPGAKPDTAGSGGIPSKNGW